ncbi:phage terminase large subunit family protein [Candidatus Nitrotoga sp. M5]|uniref:phage terminase large subunit family protein n=1 Tax=Candidatus Nitrotoga sp. M5 TaxID=2890409 RepID=UPI001EF56620|nr:phage terminase large subunit family protein [Candidatus Nitrotoga sp. M5]
MGDISRAEDLVAQLMRQYMAPPPRIDTAEWAAKYRYIAKGPERGPWRNERTPYLVEPMQCASSHAPYERVVLWFATQMGKTEVIYNTFMQRIHTDPQDMMIVQPTLQDAQDHSMQRFIPTVLQTPVMQGKVSVRRSRDSSTSWRSRSIQGGFTVFFGGANSASSLASKPLGLAAADEVDKWPADVDNEGDPLGLLEERMSNFSNRLLVVASTCSIKGQSTIESEYEASDQRKYHVPCPHCGEAQILTWGAKTEWGIKWLKTATGEARPETAVYICRHCAAAIEEHEKKYMLANGLWIPSAPGAGMGKRAGFWINKLYSPLGWKSWPALVEGWIGANEKKRTGDSAPLKKFMNSSLAETWEELGSGGDSRALSARAEDYELNTVPYGGLMLVMGVDTQPDRLEARVWAFGRGEESWLVGRHIIYGDPNLDEDTEGSPWTRLSEIRRTPIMHASGSQLLIEATCIDSGGHNTHAVYVYCRHHERANVLAVKGASTYGKPVLGKPSMIDVTHRGKTMARSLKLWPIGTDTAKHLIYGRMRVTQVGPGYVHTPKALQGTDEYEQMTAARLKPVVINGKSSMRWITPHGTREEGGDCMVYAYAAACHLGIQTFREPSWARRQDKISPRAPDLFSQSLPTVSAPVAAENKPVNASGGRISVAALRRS